jgi:spermidine synthase
VIPWQLLDSAKLDAGSELRLYRRGEEFVIRANRVELMNSRVHGSEEQLAELALAELGERPDVRVLIGGLGMGFTLARALALLGAGARVEVSELAPAVVRWNRQLLGHLAGHPLGDVRVTVLEADVAQVIDAARAEWAAILLDVDNGHVGLTCRANDRLYARGGLASIRRALRDGGVLGVWSARSDPQFTVRLRDSGFHVTEARTRARRSKGARRTIWIAKRR